MSCLEHDEHYILTFPNGYGRCVSLSLSPLEIWMWFTLASLTKVFICRSILTVPWVELGGECNISCSKSGYSANIVFHTKPFYGGKKHRITAEILYELFDISLNSPRVKTEKLKLVLFLLFFQRTQWQEVILLCWRRMERSDVCQMGDWCKSE